MSWSPFTRGGKRERRDGPDSAKSLYHNFRRLLEHNTEALERMAAMEEALGGEYVFDSAFLRQSSRELGQLVRRTVHCLNGMTRNRHLPLYDRYQALHDRIEDILSGAPSPWARALVLGFSGQAWESEAYVGREAACLAELGHHFDLPVPDGFALTAAGSAELESALRQGTSLPNSLSSALESERTALYQRRGGRCALAVFPSPLPDQGETAEQLPVRVSVGGDLVHGLRTALERYREAWPGRLQAEPPPLGVCEVRDTVLRGHIATLSASHGGLLKIVAREVGEAGEAGTDEIYWLRRSQPYGLEKSVIHAKPSDVVLPDGRTPLSHMPNGLLRGSALLDVRTMTRLAEAAMAVERIIGSPRRIEWSVDIDQEPCLESVHPLAVAEAADVDLSGLLAKASVLARGGDTAQTGVAAGRVVHVGADASAADFPAGAVAVARDAAPRLSGVLRRASALVTEAGTSVGHLATIAREYRVPALFGLHGALEALPQGTDVTVDAGEAVVYEGVLEPLLRYRVQDGEFDPDDPEYALLRRLLRHILPLRLVDPDASDFTVDNCRSYHDIIHFAHETAVRTLAEIQDGGLGLRGGDARRLELPVPMDIRVLDTGDGVAEDAGNPVRPDALRCRPLLSFLKGLERPGAWDRGPGTLGMGDVFGGLRKTMRLLSGPVGAAGSNLAIVSRDSLHLSLRLGYHFSVVDAHFADNPNHNTVYFRFVGGLADSGRRERRARLVRVLLDGLGFLTEVKGDLVIGKFKVAPLRDMETVLAHLGALTAFTRQMDTAMAEDRDVERLGRAFLGLDDVHPDELRAEGWA